MAIIPTMLIRKISGAEAPASATMTPGGEEQVERRGHLGQARHDDAEQAELAALQGCGAPWTGEVCVEAMA